MTYTKNLHRGRFNPKNPEKYRGDVTAIVYRSGYEVKFMNWCDKNSDVTEWNSEEVVVPYRSPMDNKVHRYFIDFYIKVNGKQYLIEVKPDRFTRAPVIPKRSQFKRPEEEFRLVHEASGGGRQGNQFLSVRGV